MAKIIRVDGTEEEIEFKNKDIRQGLKEKQEIVGGLIQILPLKKSGRLLIVNEEGVLMDLPENQVATDLVTDESPEYIWGGHTIRGDVIICSNEEIE